MNVIHVVGTSRMRGAERFALHLAESLCAHGFSQEILILKTAAHARFPDSLVRITSLGGEDASAFSRIRTLRRILRERDPSIVLCHGLSALKHARLATFWLPSAPALTVIKIGLTRPWMHGLDIARLSFSRWALSGVEVCVVLGPEQAKEATGLLKVPQHKLVHIPNARPSPDVQSPPSRVPDLVLMVGALTEEKQPWMGLELLRQLHDGGIQARLRYVGDGPLRSALVEQAARLSLSGHVEFMGHVDNTWPHYYEATMLFLCSRTEGVPGVVIEAALCGLPVVTWGVGDVGAVVRHEVTGLMAPYGDKDTLFSFAQQLMGNAVLGARLGAGALKQSSAFTMDSVAEQYASLLRAVMRARSGS